MRDLLLTLGHNASATLVEDGRVLNAYEAERLTGVKSDSRFPVDAIDALHTRSAVRLGAKVFDRVYVTHWAPDGRLSAMKSKYWNPSIFSSSTLIISQENLKMTHHDAHAYAALAFAGDSFPKSDAGVLVIDGFGTRSEHLSYYKLSMGRPVLVSRFYGYESSLGLMYQYVTAVLGMKMHEDEYKLLGYGSKILSDQISQANDVAFKYSKKYLRTMRAGPSPKISYELESLPLVQEQWGKAVQEMLVDMGMQGTDVTSEQSRVVVGYIVQRILETVVLNVVEHDFGGWPTNLICSGGVFYNVALNRLVTKRVKGKVCIMPLAGDQGNSIGVWQVDNRKTPFDFGDLCWGVRNMNLDPSMYPTGMIMCDEAEAVGVIEENLEQVGFVNVVRGKTEFGPRALCNTTTLARADDPNIAAQINIANERNNVMPFAPVVWHEHAQHVFPEIGKLHKSERYMICALDYNTSVGAKFPGAALRTAHGNVTGRPQIYEPKSRFDPIGQIVEKYGLLINTSFNVHGVPICCDIKTVVHSHQFQRERNPHVTTVVIKEST